MFSTLMVALKAIPQIVNAVNGLTAAYKRTQYELIESQYNKKIQEMKTLVKKLEYASDRNETADIIRSINSYN